MKRLLVGYKSPELTPALLEGETVVHELDIYHAHAVEKAHPGVSVVCTPHLPEGPWDEILFRTGPKLMSGELSLDLLQDCHRFGCPVKVDFVGRERDRNDLLSKIADDPKRVRCFRAEWPASVPGGEKLLFTSYPGCFCHRRLDEGGLALAEVVTRDLLKEGSEAGRGAPLRILDMGCGCGLVGFLIANRLAGGRTAEASHRRAISLVLVDSHARAVEAAKENAVKFALPAEVLLSDSGTPASTDGTFDVFVGNPPYYSDYRIADLFLETAKRALKPGGVCYAVCKNAAGLKPVQERFFPSVEVLPRRGYSVLKSHALSEA